MRWLVGLVLALLVGAVAVTTVGDAVERQSPLGRPATTAGAPPASVTSEAPSPVPTAPSSGEGATTAPPPPTTAVGRFSAAEVAAHASSDSCWLIVSDRVYDVTDYLRRHPGGSRTITPWCGKESTEAFATEDGAGEHSDAAYTLLEDYYLGPLAP